jgi:hypothetical protein
MSFSPAVLAHAFILADNVGLQIAETQRRTRIELGRDFARDAETRGKMGDDK